MTIGTENAAATQNEFVDDFLIYETPRVQAIDPAQAEFDALCFRALEQSEDGKALMVELNKLLANPSWEPNQAKGLAAFREGEKNLIRFLAQCISRFKQPKGA